MIYDGILRPAFVASCILYACVAGAGEGGLIETRQPLWSFDAAEGWFVWKDGNDQRTTRVSAEPTGTRLELHAAKGNLNFPTLSSRACEAGSIGRPVSLRMRIELLEGEASIGLNLQDSQGEGMNFGDRPLERGSNELIWKVADADIVHSWGDKANKRIDGDLALWNLMLTATTTDGPVAVRLIAVETVIRSPVLSLIDVSLVTGNPIPVLRTGEESRLAFELKSRSPERVNVSISTRMTDFFGATLAAETTLALAPGSTKRWRPGVRIENRGVYWVEYTLREEGTDSATSGRRTFALIDPIQTRPGREKGFLFSTNGMIPREPDPAALEKCIWAARLIGVEVTRESFGWEMLEPVRGRWNEERLAWFDQAVEQLSANGIEVQHLLAYCAQWAADPSRSTWKAEGPVGWLFTPPPLDAWNAYVSRLVNRLRDRITYWEVWNEADLSCFWTGTAEQYAELLRTTYATIKAIDPELQVMTCGFATLQPHGDRKTPNLMARVVKDTRGEFDILAFHEHHRFGNFRKSVDGPLAEIRKSLPEGFPIYFNECSWGRDGRDERAPAIQMVKKLTYARSAGAMGFTQFDFRSGHLDATRGGHNWGMLTGDFQPVSSFPAYNALVTVLRDKEFVKAFDLGPSRFGLLFSGRGEHTVVLWDEEAGAEGAPPVFLVDAARAAHSVDIMGNEKRTQPVEGRLAVEISQYPQYLVVESSRAPILAERFVSPQGGSTVIPGQRLALRTVLVNSYDESKTFNLKWELPRAFGANRTVRESYKLGANDRTTVETDLVVPRSFDARFAEVLLAELSYEVGGTPWKDTISVPLRMGAFVDARQRDREADFVLDSERQVQNLFVNLPQKQHLTWQGPQDLSARVWLGVTGTSLTLRIAVKDDRHIQEHTGGGIWQGDSIQMGITRPGWKGYYEIGLARRQIGGSTTSVWMQPEGRPHLRPESIALATSSSGGSVEYNARISLAALGLDKASLQDGIKFNLIVNDNDGSEREGWIELAPGLGSGKDPERFPLVVFGF